MGRVARFVEALTFQEASGECSKVGDTACGVRVVREDRCIGAGSRLIDVLPPLRGLFLRFRD